MKIRTVVLVALGAALPTLATAQSTSSSGGWTMPYERGFWGHAGISAGGARLDVTCPPTSVCDDDDQAFRIYGGGTFKGMFGGEIGWIKFGDFTRAGGSTDASGWDLALTAGVPFGTNWRVFGKLGAVYSDVDVTGVGIPTGSDNGWGARAGLGLQMGITDNLALRADVDRFRIKVPGGRENVDSFLVGVQYTFR